MADLSNSSNIMALEELLEDLHKGIDINLHSHCYRVKEQGIIMMKISVIDELRMYDLPRHSKSTTAFISGLLTFVDELINKKRSVDPIHVIQKSAIEKPANNPCKNLPDSAVAKRSQMQPNIMKYTKTCVYGQMLWIGRIRSDKFRRGFVIRSFALIVPDWPILHRL